MTNEELKKILENHQHWLKGDSDNWQELCADLRYTDLRYTDLRYTDLRYTNLSGADLRGADLRYTNLSGANLRYTNLSGANLRYADLSGANLNGINLNGANLKGANLSGANLIDANLIDANLIGANLIGANLKGANLIGANLIDANLIDANLIDANLIGAKNVPFMPMACPSDGGFIGWKKALVVDGEACIIRLYIPAEAKRSSAMGRKCRCNKAKVLSIEVLETGEKISTAFSSYDKTFIYKEGEYVEVDNFDEDRFNECAPGIHFFINKQEAIDY